MIERIPPHNEEAERSVLGATMLNKEVLFDILEEVREDDFYNESHKEIFRAILGAVPQKQRGRYAHRLRRIKKQTIAGHGRRQSLYRDTHRGGSGHRERQGIREDHRRKKR